MLMQSSKLDAVDTDNSTDKYSNNLSKTDKKDQSSKRIEIHRVWLHLGNNYVVEELWAEEEAILMPRQQPVMEAIN